MNHFEMQNNHLYKHSLVEKLQDQVGLLDEVILDFDEWFRSLWGEYNRT